METPEFIVILKSGHQFRIYESSAMRLAERMKSPTGALQWQWFTDGDNLQYMFSLQDVEAIVKENYVIHGTVLHRPG